MESKRLRSNALTNGAYLLIDSFNGALSDFADETTVDAYDTKKKAIREVIDRVHILAKFHEDEFDANEMPPFPTDKDIQTEMSKRGKLKYVSEDGCGYTWQIIFNPSISIRNAQMAKC